MSGCFRPYISFVSSLQCLECVFGSMAVILFRFVVHERNVEVLFAGHPLNQGVGAIKKRMPLSVPVDSKRVAAYFLCFLSLSMDDSRVVAVVLNPDMIRITKPRLKRSDDLRPLIVVRDISKAVLAAAMVARMWYKAGRDQ